MLLVPAGCGRYKPRPGQLPPSGTVLFVIGPSEFDPRWPALRGGVRRALREAPYLKGEFVNVQSPDHADLESLVQLGLDHQARALCIYSDDATADRAAIARAAGGGKTVILMGGALEAEGATGLVRVDLIGGAGLLSDKLGGVAGGRLSYALLHASGTSELGTRCFQSFGRNPLDRPSLRLLEERAISGDAAAWQDAVQQTVRRFPNVGLVVTLDPRPWLHEAPRLRLPAANCFVTLGAAPNLWPRLRSGEAAALVGALDGEVGYAAGRMAIAALIGAELESTERIIPCELVTAANLDDFARRYSEAGELGSN
ncbi:hypothetical protein RAS1_16160 [Phycisphaerae bacterium RAS1]|nr:hypothetical protein RAS1_16160 [Phycisphaerae bacterium RAS1]